MNGSGIRTAAQLSCVALLLVGCSAEEQAGIDRRPRPVVTQMLSRKMPPTAALVTASAGAWKTEELGFEVSGRVKFVVDQNTEIEGRIRDAAGKLIVDGTPIAKIESERYELNVASATAAVARAEQDQIVAQTDLDETIPARISAATSEVELARVEFERSTRLKAQNAGSQSALDTAKANYDTSMAELKQLIASEKSQKAQIESLKKGVLQAEQQLRDANRDLEDCTLYSSFRGLVANTSVVPGSLVVAGSPVVTLQMMDPIKVELEVSAQQSRRLQRASTLPVHVTMPDGHVEIREGFLHQIAPSADPLTRTFTLTILVLNQRLTNDEDEQTARTRDIWRLDLAFIPGAEPDDLYVEENAILTDEDGPYLWRVINATLQNRGPTDHVLEVRRLRITTDGQKVPYLGELVFQRVELLDESFDPQQNFVIGALDISGMKPHEWDGEKVLLDSPGRWMLRPGDLVKVDLSKQDSSAGYYVPMDAISRKGDSTSIFVVDPGGDQTTVRQVSVELDSDNRRSAPSGLRRVKPVGNETLDGVRYVTKGTHFLIDGEAVTVVSDSEAN